jgi:UDP-glucose 4-epimerase
MSEALNVLITGASGFIGSNLVNHLIKQEGITIFPVYRKNAPTGLKNTHPVIADLSDEHFTNLLPNNINVIVHLAQSKEYRNFPEQANDIFTINVLATHKLLEWARKTGVSKFIFASTGNVYKQQNKLLSESDLCEPISYYGGSKYAAEQLISNYSQFFATTILRMFGVYGPGQVNMIVPNIISRIRSQKEIILAKNVGLYFTPIYITDCVRMLSKVIYSENIMKIGIYNISGNETKNLHEMTIVAGQLLGLTPLYNITNDEPAFLMGSNAKFLNDYGYKPDVNLEMGLETTINYQC